MKFREKLTTKQYHSVFYLILGLIILYIIYFNKESLRIFGFFIALILIINAVFLFFEESKRKYKILHEDHSGSYSLGERKIAEYFKRKSIKFHFRPKINLYKNYGPFQFPFIKKELEPDFFLPEYNLFVEFWGKIDDPEYKEKSFRQKRKMYRDNGVDLISLYPKNLNKNNLDWNFTQKLLEIIRSREGIALHYKG